MTMATRARASARDTIAWFGGSRGFLTAVSVVALGVLAVWLLPLPWEPATAALGEELFFGVVIPVVLFVGVFLWHFLYRTPRRLHDETLATELERELREGSDEALKAWLSRELRGGEYGIRRAYLFGSIVQPRASRDVDILVQFQPGSGHEWRRRWRAIRANVERTLEEAYGKPANWQFFASDEDDKIQHFLTRAGDHEVILDRE